MSESKPLVSIEEEHMPLEKSEVPLSSLIIEAFQQEAAVLPKLPDSIYRASAEVICFLEESLRIFQEEEK